jgi:superoxide reductase
MTEKKEIYKCEICGNIVEVVHEGEGTLVCCGQPMKLQKENEVDASLEKHVPIIDGKKVKVGSEKHPMTAEHYIEWIEATSENGEISKIFLTPNSKPEAKFSFKPIRARAHCNLHGLWKSNEE